jgi:hypothetical protein
VANETKRVTMSYVANETKGVTIQYVTNETKGITMELSENITVIMNLMQRNMDVSKARKLGPRFFMDYRVYAFHHCENISQNWYSYAYGVNNRRKNTRKWN